MVFKSVNGFITLCFIAQIWGCKCAEIVSLSPNEWQSYRELRLRAVQEELYAFGPSYEEELLVSELEWRKRIEKMVFAKTGGKLVGMLAFDRWPPARSQHVVHLSSFYVVPEKRKQGIGRSLLNYVINKLKATDKVKKIVACVQSPMAIQAPTVDLFKKFNFTISGKLEKETLINGQYYDVYIVTLFL